MQLRRNWLDGLYLGLGDVDDGDDDDDDDDDDVVVIELRGI
jgi:hypothetical protein